MSTRTPVKCGFTLGIEAAPRLYPSAAPETHAPVMMTTSARKRQGNSTHNHDQTQPQPTSQGLAFGLLFPVNLVLILLTGGQLFTGNSAAMPAAVYEGKATVKGTHVLRGS